MRGSFFLEKDTGEVVLVSNEVMRTVEDGDPTEGLADWEREQILAAEQIVGETGAYISLPSRFDIHEYRIMEESCLSLGDSDPGGTLLDRIKRSGAFRRFKYAIQEHCIQNQ